MAYGAYDNVIVTYVPMYIKKQKKRGFNQAEIIAKEIGRKTGLPVVKMLEKTRETKDQAKGSVPYTYLPGIVGDILFWSSSENDLCFVL